MTSGIRLTFDVVIQANLESLVDVCLSLPSGDMSDDARLALFYGQTIVHFLRGETDELSAKRAGVAIEFATHPELEELELAIALREAIRMRELDPELIEKAEAAVATPADATASPTALKWRGEIAILLATMYTILDDYTKAAAMFAIAAQALLVAGFLRKSLRAQMNTLVCESHLNPGKNLFTRYHDLYRQAIQRDRRELIVATTCLLNISREYQRAGASLAALKYCNRGLALFERQMGDINYYLTLVHRAQLLCALGRISEARIDIDTAKLAPFKEVHAALEVVMPLLEGRRPESIETKDLLPTWKERLDEVNSEDVRPKLSALEEKLLSILSRGPRERIDLADEIYGDRLDIDTKQNRFKSLIGTFRKKCPDLVIFDQGRYRLADQILIQKPNVS